MPLLRSRTFHLAAPGHRCSGFLGQVNVSQMLLTIVLLLPGAPSRPYISYNLGRKSTPENPESFLRPPAHARPPPKPVTILVAFSP